MIRQTKFAATISLVIMAAGFFITIPFRDQVWATVLMGAFEAGLVGGLADWFAITALFRHPLGIPIPHTSLLTKNREKITNTFIHTVENELLNKQSVKQKMAQMNLFAKILDASAEQLQTDTAPKALLRISKVIVNQLPVESISAAAAQYARTWLGSVQTEQWLEKTAYQLMIRGYDERAFDFALDKAAQWASKDEVSDELGRIAQDMLGKLQTNGFMQFAVNAFIGFMSEDKLGRMLQDMLLSGLNQLRQTDNPHRHYLLTEIRHQLSHLHENPNVISELDNLKNTFIHAPAFDETVKKAVETIREKMLEYLEKDEDAGGLLVSYALRFIEQLRQNPTVMEQGETWVQSRVYGFIEANHHKIGYLIRENVEKLDDETLISLIEDKVGTDLQWIRVNGAVCGFMIGLVLAVFHL